MKVKVYVPRMFEIPDYQLADIARRIKNRRYKNGLLHPFPGAVDLWQIIDVAITEGVIQPGEDYSTPRDEDRVYWKGRVMPATEARKLHNLSRRPKKK